MALQEIVMTQEGYNKTQEEFEHLVNVERGRIARDIEAARAQGDLSENSEYDEAKNEQAIVESRIQELEGILKRARVIDLSQRSNEQVQMLSKVKVHDWEFDEDVVYQIVSTKESNPFENKLSDESPVGMALLNRRVGDIVDVETPDGIMKFSVLEITI